MKKFSLLFLVFLFFCAQNSPDPQNVKSYAQALQLAKQLNRPVLIDFMTDW